MSKTYQIQTTDTQGQRRSQTLSSGSGHAPTTISTAPGERHVLLDVQQGSAPDNIRVQRAGKQLRVWFDGSTQADLVLDNFYSDTEGTPSTLAGSTDTGALHAYLPESAQPQDTVLRLADSATPQGMALGGEALPAYEVTGAAVGLLAPVAAAGGIGLGTIGAGLLGAAALAGGGGGGSSGGGSPVDPNSKLQPTIARMSHDTATDGDWITSDTTPTFSGHFGTGQAWTSNGDHFRFQLFKQSGENLMTVDEAAISTDKTTWSATSTALADGTYLARTIITDTIGHVLSLDQQAFVIDHTAASCVADHDVHVDLHAITGGYEIKSFALSSNEAVHYSIRDGSDNLIAQGTYDGMATNASSDTPKIKGTFAAGQFILTYADAAGNVSQYVNDSTWDFNDIPITTVSPTDTYQSPPNLSLPLGTVGTYTLHDSESLDLTNLLLDTMQRPAIHNTIDMSGTSAQGLSLSLNDVLSVGVRNAFQADNKVQLLVKGSVQDKVSFEDLTAWDLSHPTDTPVNGVHYQTYASHDGLAEVLIQQGVVVG